LPPSVVASAAASVKAISRSGNRRAHLWENARQLHSGLKQAGFTMCTKTAESPIIAVHLPDVMIGTKFWEQLLTEGVYANMAAPPATPAGMFLLRISVCAQHTSEQVAEIIARFRRTAEKVGLEV